MGAPYEAGVGGSRGAPMGRVSDLPEDTTEKLYLRRMRLYDGCYDKGGAYWGAPDTMWCAWDSDGRALYVRAHSRGAAKAKVLESCPRARFFR